jgi:carboxypeptidase Q
MISRGQRIVLKIYMEAHYEGTTTSHNLVGEFVGSKFPEEIILLGGHIDSWDVGPQTGANDDAAGVMVCLQSVLTLIKLGLRPKRTLRFIAWSGEEMGFPNNGAFVYSQKHQDQMKNHILAFESDYGTRRIKGWGFSGNQMSYTVINKINELFLNPILNVTSVKINDGVMTDTEPLFKRYNIPVMRNIVEDTEDGQYYFTYHHSAGDSMNILDADDMDSNVMAISSLFYILGDSQDRLPH